MKKVRLPRSVILVAVLYLVAATSAAITLQNWDFLKTYIPFFIAIAAFIALMHRRVHFSMALLWSLTLWGALHLAGGLVRIPETWDSEGEQTILYSWWVIGSWLKYDQVVQAFGFGTCTWLIWEALRASIQARLGRKLYPSMGMIFLCVFAGMGLGALTEIVGYLADLNLAQLDTSRYLDTCKDLLANLVGCLFVGVLILFRG